MYKLVFVVTLDKAPILGKASTSLASLLLDVKGLLSLGASKLSYPNILSISAIALLGALALLSKAYTKVSDNTSNRDKVRLAKGPLEKPLLEDSYIAVEAIGCLRLVANFRVGLGGLLT